MKLYPLSFKNNIQYIRNKRIFEYDIQSAGYSIAISENLINDEKLLIKLKSANKKERQILLGLYAKNNKEFVTLLNDGFRKYISAFIEYNDIKESTLLFIKKDSVTFFNNIKIKKTKFKKAIFSKREEFTSFLTLGKLEFYYNGKTNKRLLKGITLKNYKYTLIEEIFEILHLAEFATKDTIELRLAELRSAYVNKELDDSYYRELSNTHAFKLYDGLNGHNIYSDYPLRDGDEFFDDIDISYNYLNLLLPLFDIFV